MTVGLGFMIARVLQLWRLKDTCAGYVLHHRLFKLQGQWQPIFTSDLGSGWSGATFVEDKERPSHNTSGILRRMVCLERNCENRIDRYNRIWLKRSILRPVLRWDRNIPTRRTAHCNIHRSTDLTLRKDHGSRSANVRTGRWVSAFVYYTDSSHNAAGQFHKSVCDKTDEMN